MIIGVLACSLQAIQRFERDENLMMEVLARAQLVACIGILASLFFASNEYNKQLWLLLAMGPVMLAIAKLRDLTQPKRGRNSWSSPSSRASRPGPESIRRNAVFAFGIRVVSAVFDGGLTLLVRYLGP